MMKKVKMSIKVLVSLSESPSVNKLKLILPYKLTVSLYNLMSVLTMTIDRFR